MTDDLVKRLRKGIMCGDDPIVEEAADRIEKLEAALLEIAAGYETEWSTSSVTNMLNIAQILSERIVIARKALEGKDGSQADL
jgi:hypothetical protein